MKIHLWHKTTKTNAKNIFKKGFSLSKRGSGALGSKSDIPGISFGSGLYRFSNEQIAYELGVSPSEIVTISGTADVKLYQTDYYKEPSKKSLTRKGYDGVIYPSGEVVLFNPNKLIFDFETKLLRDIL